ncbi:MAG: glycoside hydrolase family 38 C-terminal domain-containing protein [Gaiellaceae bacterium]
MRSEPRRTFAAGVALPEARLPEAARNELRRGTTGVELEIGGVKVRAGDLPLFRRSAAGLRQCVRVAISAEEDRGPARFALLDGDRVLDETTVEIVQGDHSLRLFAPEALEPKLLRLMVEGEGALRLEHPLEVRPQRKWRLFLIHHSHLDIGYTDPQALLLSHHLSYLDSTLDLAAATDDWPDDARFRWNVEANWARERWLGARPAAARPELVARVQERRFEVCALPFTLHAEALSIDELARQLCFADELGASTGVPIVTAMQTDVPGAPAGLVDLLAAAGVRYLSVAHNYAGRAAPYLTGGQELTRPFWWESESGRRVLTWYTDSPHGIAYLEGNLVGLAESYETSLELLPEYLAALAGRPYPYGHGRAHEGLGLPPDLELTRAPYPYDLLQLRVQGAIADNAGPSLVPAEVVRAWNDEWAHPQLRLATNAEFFAEAEVRLGDGLETYTGDWTDWWADGLGSSARALGLNRRAQATIRTAQTLHVLADAVAGTDGSAAWEEEADRAYESMSLFDEHTWGAAEPAGDSLVGRSSGAAQWQAKAAMATAAHDRSAALLESATSRLAHLVGSVPDALASLLVFNPSSWARTDAVRVFVPSSRIPPARSFGVRGADGAAVPHAEEQQSGQANRNRPQGRWLTFVAEEVPPLGFRRYLLVDGQPQLAADPALLDALENEHYRVELDPLEGCVLSILDKALGRELVDTGSPFGFGQYVYDAYTSSLRSSLRLPVGGALVNAPTAGSLEPGPRSGSRAALLGSRSTANYGVVTERTANEVEQRLSIRLVAPGADRLETTFRLLHGVKRLEIRHRLAKLATAEKESVHFVFPFALHEPLVELELTGAVGGPAAPRVPGSAAHVAVLRHWVALRDPTATVAWSPDEAALVQLGNIVLPYPPFPATVDGSRPGTVVSWAMTNVWDTNFPVTQGGEAEFSYALASAGPQADGRELGRETAAALTRPFVGVLGAPRNHDSGLVGTASFCAVDRADVEVVALAASRRGHDFVVFLQSTATEEVEVTVGFPDLRVERVLAGTFLERGLVDVGSADGARVRIGPGEYLALSVDLARR